MIQIDYSQIITNISVIQELQELIVEEKPNEHTTLYLTGIMKENASDDYVTSAKENQVIEVSNSATGKSLFTGLIQSIEIYMSGGLRYLEVRGISFSYLLDIKKKRRSFQDVSQTYKDLLRKIVKEYNGGDLMDFCTNGKTIGQLWVQYDETDWEFIKRMASHFNQAIFPDSHFDAPKIILGRKKGANLGKLTDYNYRVSKNLLEYKTLRDNYIDNLQERERLVYKIKTKEDYQIGDEVSYQNKQLFVCKKEMRMMGSVLEFFYELCGEKGFLTSYQPNRNIVGVSIRGQVIDRVKEKVKVKLEIDEQQDKSKAWEFSYSTAYAAEGFSGWYCMPELGDTVNIYFPKADEKEAFGMESLRVHPGGGDKINDPSVKYFATPYGKEIMFKPDEIKITCRGKDSQDKNIYIRLNEGDGVVIYSSENIQMKAKKSITMDSGGSINLVAKKKLNLRCKSGEISMGSKIEVNGEDVRIN